MRMPGHLLRIALVLTFGQLVTACTSFSAMNPFDGDPNGPPPAPHLWKGAYDGDDGARDTVSRDDVGKAKPAHRSGSGKSDYDRSYGTNSIESSELPPPDEVADARPTRSAEPRRAAAPANDDDEVRSLNTSRSATQKTKVHVVRKGEQVADVADQYGVREVDIIALNQLRPPYTLKPGQELQVPVKDTATASADDAPEPRAKPGSSAPSKAPPGDAPRFDWPVNGKVVAGFGASGDGLYNEGINIAVPVGTRVRASAGGTIKYAGNELKGYGNLILIDHGGGYITAYAHNDSLNVKRGDKVSRGDEIALSGRTGNVKSPQLHFEIRKGTESVDPRKYLTTLSN